LRVWFSLNFLYSLFFTSAASSDNWPLLKI
jgi:hypothetical protein